MSEIFGEKQYMYAIEVTTEFCAAHQLRLANGGVEPLHGHNWRVTVQVESRNLNALETVMDFHALQALVEQIVQPWANRNLNECPPFDRQWNPSAERVAEYIGKALAKRMVASVRLGEVRITEAPGCAAIFRPE